MSKWCIPTQWVNDLIADCTYYSASDMSYHYEDEPLLSRPVNSSNDYCSESTQLPCMLGHSQCFNISQLCNYDLDAYGHIKYCRNGAHLESCSAFQCIGMYKCPMSYCIQSVRVCDGRVDCPAGEDEVDCPAETGALICPGFLKCKGGGCVHPDRVCDGKRDCVKYGDDELLCDLNPVCPPRCVCHWYSIECFNIGQSQLNINHMKYVRIFNNLKLFPVLTSGEKVVILNVSQNNLDKISSKYFISTPNVAIIDMTYCGIYIIRENCFSGLSNLREVYLEHNHITTIEPHSFVNLLKLQILNLSNISVLALHASALVKIPEISKIDLSNGKMTSLNFSLFASMPLLLELNIEGNPLISVTTAALSNRTKLKTNIGYLCCFASTKSCIGTTPEPSLCLRDIHVKNKSIALATPCGVMAVHLMALIVRPMAGLTGPNDIVDNGVNMAAIAVCFSAIMGLIQSVIFPSSEVHAVGGYRHVWCMTASAVQYVGLLSPYMFACVWIIFVYKVYRNASTLSTDMHYRRKIGFQLLIIVGLLSVVIVVIIMIYANLYGQFPSQTDLCSIYFPREPKGNAVIAMLAIQLILQNGSFLLCCIIISLIVKKINQTDSVLNTTESRRIGGFNQKRKILFLFVEKCVLVYVMGFPVQIIIFMVYDSQRSFYDFEWHFTNTFIPLLTTLNPICLLYHCCKMCHKKYSVKRTNSIIKNEKRRI